MHQDLCETWNGVFHATLNPGRFVANARQEEVLSRLCYLVEQRRPFGMLTGPAGTGKSFVLQLLKQQLLRTQRETVVVDLSGADSRTFLWNTAAGLGLGPGESETSIRLQRLIEDQLTGLKWTNMQTVLVCDHLDRSVGDCARTIERLLAVDRGRVCWLTVLVATQSEDTHPALAELSDLRIESSAFNRSETARYIHALLKQAGLSRELFDASACERIFEATGGIPREINKVSQIALLASLGVEGEPVNVSAVESASTEIGETTSKAALQPVVE
jgi:general secretion pathway protein A